MAGDLSRACEEERGPLGLAGPLQGRFQAGDVAGAEHEAVAGRDVHEVEVDAGSRDLAGQVGENARPILDLDDDDLAFAADGELRDGERAPYGFYVRDEDV